MPISWDGTKNGMVRRIIIHTAAVYYLKRANVPHINHQLSKLHMLD